MNSLLFALLHDWHFQWKAAIGSSVAAFAMLADIASEAKGWEDVGLKVLLLIAVVFLVNLLLKQQAQHKADSDAREQKVLDALNRTADGMEALTTLTQEQTDFFKSVVKNVVSERLQGPNYSIHKKDGS